MNIFNFFGITQQGLILFLLIAIVAFFIFRELVTWYLKMNKVVSLLEKIEENTRSNVTQKITENVLDPKVQSTQTNKPQRTGLDKWWNGPDA